MNTVKRGFAARCAERLCLSVGLPLNARGYASFSASIVRGVASHFLGRICRKGTAFPHISGQSPKTIFYGNHFSNTISWLGKSRTQALAEFLIKNKNPIGFSPCCAKAKRMIDKLSYSAKAVRQIFKLTSN